MLDKQKLKNNVEHQIAELEKFIAVNEASINQSENMVESLDKANNTIEESLIFTTLNLRRNRLNQLRKALATMAHKDYGKCSACGNPIEFARLEVVPFADKCAECAALTFNKSRHLAALTRI